MQRQVQVKLRTSEPARTGAAEPAGKRISAAPHWRANLVASPGHGNSDLLTHELAAAVQQAGVAAQVQRKNIADAGTVDGGAKDSATADGGSGGSGGTRRIFALTFDDGPHSAPLGKGLNLTEQVLDTLASRGVKAGFFVQTGVPFRAANPVGRALIKRMHSDGHSIGIHTGGSIDHELHPRAESAGRLASELKAAGEFIGAQTGVTTKLVRPPEGVFNAAVDAVYAKGGLTKLLWDIDGDKNASTLASQRDRLSSAGSIEPGIPAVASRGWVGTTPVRPKIVVLYHDIRPATAANIGSLIDEIGAVTSAVSGGKDTVEFAPP